MKQLVLSQKSSDSQAKALAEGLVKLRGQKGRVYQTIVRPGLCPRDSHVRPTELHLATTSKDVHLWLGQMEESLKWELALYLKCAIETAIEGILMILEYTDHGETRREYALYATGGSHTDTIHLSPAS